MAAPGEAADAQRLQDVLQRLQRLCHAEEPRRLWWVGAALLEGVQTGGAGQFPAVKLLFGKVDREIKRLVDAGEASFRTSPPRELVKNLHYVAHGSGGGPLTAEVRRTYALDALMPSQRELEHASLIDFRPQPRPPLIPYRRPSRTTSCASSEG